MSETARRARAEGASIILTGRHGLNDPHSARAGTAPPDRRHEREMICDRGSAVRGSMTSPDVRAPSRAYVAGLERHKMEEWRTNAASGPRLGASSMTNRLYSSLDERRAQVIPNFILKRRFPPIS